MWSTRIIRIGEPVRQTEIALQTLITQTRTQSLRVRHCINTEEDRKGHDFSNTHALKHAQAFRSSSGRKISLNTGVNIQWCAEFVPSAPMDTSLTPLLAMKSSALLTLLILWTLIFPLSGLGNLSPAQRHEKFSHAFHRISTNTTPRLNISSALLQRFINELEASGWMKEVCSSLTCDDLEEQHEFESISEILLDVFDLRSRLPQVRVAPGRESLEQTGNDVKNSGSKVRETGNGCRNAQDVCAGNERENQHLMRLERKWKTTSCTKQYNTEILHASLIKYDNYIRWEELKF